MCKVENFKADRLFGHNKADKEEGEGSEGQILKRLLSPTESEGGYLGQQQKSWELFHQSLSIYKKKFPNNLT